jgi:cell division protein YceG involved in septum cleavage
LARGDRPSHERTSEEREQARVDRERRRAEREGRPAPAPGAAPDDSIAEPTPVEPQPVAGSLLDAHPEPGGDAEPEPAREVALEGEVAPAPEVEHEAAPEPAPPLEPPAAPAVEDEPALALEHEPGPTLEHEAAADPGSAPEHELAPAPEAEHVDPASVPLAADPLEEELPIAPPEPADPPVLPPEPVIVAAVLPEEEGHAPLDPVEPTEVPVVLPEDTVGEEEAPGYPIPGLPADQGRPPREPLPEAPPRVRRSERPPMRRAFRRADDGAAAGAESVGLAGGGRSSRERRMTGRWIAVLALIAIGVVVAVLIYGLTRSSSHKTPAALPVVKVLIPEGKTRLQIAQIASAAGLKGSYRAAARSSPLLNPVQYGAPHGTRTLEGFLFPATYDMDRGGPSARLVEDQLTAFQENFGDEYVKRAKALGLTPYELLTVASMIEREAQVPSDRAKIAAVIYNRLKAGIPLGIDATIYYEIENGHNIPTYTKELTASQLAVDSPYNTRLHKGLPPTPISNPGVASIQAAAHPAHVSYLYYVAGADGCGEQKFATTEAKFNEDVAAYEAAKQKNGGHLPACKHG